MFTLLDEERARKFWEEEIRQEGEKKGIAIGEKNGEKRGIAIGEKKGIAIGEDDLSEVLDALFEQGRDAEARRAMKDKQFRAQILEAFRAKRSAATV